MSDAQRAQPQAQEQVLESALLDQICAEGKVAKTDERGKSLVREFVNQILQGQMTVSRDAEATINARIAREMSQGKLSQYQGTRMMSVVGLIGEGMLQNTGIRFRTMTDKSLMGYYNWAMDTVTPFRAAAAATAAAASTMPAPQVWVVQMHSLFCKSEELVGT